MNKDIKILFENEKYYYICFEKGGDEFKYCIVGKNDIFNYEKILIVENNYVKLMKEDVLKYLSIRVNYMVTDDQFDRDILVGTSNELVFKDNEFKNIDVKWIKSYNGMTMSFITDDIYDKYYLYEKKKNNFELICESEDFQITSSLFKKGNYYFVEGYKKSESGYILSAYSKEVKCECINFGLCEKKLSIVIPVYNCEKFLCRCVDSVLLSSFKDIELIIVDDGSLDSSSQIADWYGNEYSDIVKVIHKENEGVSTARNEGIKAALGEYIAFLDNDDFVQPNMYEKLYSMAVKNDLDVVICPVIVRKGLGEYNICLDVKKYDDTFIYDYEKMISDKIDNSSNNIFFVAIWNKIMRTKIVKNHLFFSDNYYEDTAFTNTIYSYIDRFGFCKNVYYVWEKRNRSTVGTATNSYRKKLDVLSLNEKYCTALFYAVYNGNTVRRDLLIYDAIREVIMYTKEVDVFDSTSKVFLIFKREIIKINEMYDILTNPYLQADRDLYDDVRKILS